MVVRKTKKVRKFRGHRSYGYGSHKKARGAGNRGGRGMAGLHKHKWSYTVKYAPEHFGKRGFKIPQAAQKEVKSINLMELDQRAEQLLKEKIAEKDGDKIKINVMKLGCEKVLGSGKLSKPLIVEAKYFSEQAVKKLEESGGKAVKVE
jgi:large subunit ribosomal protein L15